MMEYYDYPERSDRKDIFAVSDDNYFLKSDKFSYLCGFGEIDKVNMQTDFLGSLMLVIYKRCAVVEKGNVIFRNDNFSDNNKAKGRYKDNGFVIICDTPTEYYIQSWGKSLESYEIRDDSGYNKALSPVIFSTVDKAVSAAKEISEKSQNKYIVAQWFDDFDRH